MTGFSNLPENGSAHACEASILFGIKRMETAFVTIPVFQVGTKM